MSSPTYRLVRPSTTPVVPELDAQQQARRRPPRRSAARPRRSRHRQDHDAGRGDRAPHRRGRPPRLGPGADVLAQGRRAAPRPGRRPRRAHHVGQHRLDVPLLRLRPDPPLRARPSSTSGRCGCCPRPSRTSCSASCSRTTPSRSAGPSRCGSALGTRGFAREVHAVLSRAREKGLDGDELLRLGESEGLPEFVAAGAFLEQYLTILDDRGAVDYADLIRRATIEATAAPRRAARRVRARLRRRVPGHRLRPGRAAAGDRRGRPRPGRGRRPAPVDLRVPRRRGARHPRLPDASSRRPTARPADVVALGTTRRFGPRILTAAQRVAGRIGLPGSIPEAARAAFLAPTAVDGRARRRPGRRPHLRQRPRRGRAPRRPAAPRAPRGRHRLGRDGGAGPVGPPVDPAAAPLARRGRGPGRGRERRGAARPRPGGAAADRRAARRAQPRQRRPRPRRPHRRGARRGAADRAARRPGRRRRAPPGPRSCGSARRPPPRPRTGTPPTRASWSASPCSTRRALDGLDGPGGRARPRGRRPRRRHPRPARRRCDAPRSCSGRCGPARPGPAGCAAPSSSAAAPPGARTATSTRSARCSRRPPAPRRPATTSGVREFLATLVAQQIPADTLAERGARGAAVRLLTAHRAKGLEWRLVVVAHVQQDGWPDLRRRSTLLGADRIGTDGLVPPTTARETAGRGAPAVLRRLHPRPRAARRHRGRVPRGRRRPAVAVPRRARRHRRGGRRAARRGPCRSAAWSASCAVRPPTPRRSPALRDGGRPPAGAAGRRDRRRPAAGADGRPVDLVGHPRGDPVGPAAARPGRAGADVGLDARRHLTCPTQWFLSREAGGVARQHQSANLGEIVHALAQRVANGELAVTPDAAGVESLMGHVDAVWDRMEFRTPWAQASASSSGSEAALGRFLLWHHRNPRTVVGIEQEFKAVLDLPDGEQVRLTGYADRLELDADGRVVVVDLKTGRSKPTDKSVPEQRPARALPARRRPRRGRRASVEAGRPAEPSSSSSGSVTDAPEAVVQAQAAQADDGPERAAAARAALPRGGAAAPEEFPAVVGPRSAATARSCRSARSRAPVRWWPGDAAHRSASGRGPRRGHARRLGGQRAAVGGDHRAARARGRHRRRRVRQDHADGRARRLPRAHRPGPPRRGARPDLHHQGGQRAARPDPRGAARRGRARRQRPRTTRTSSSRPSRRTTPTPPGCSPTTACGSATSPTPG